jgi:NAD-dependent dihydropyrimidine dehydrogenase PreA subunit
MPYTANPDTCTGCGTCADDCPCGAITMKNGVAVTDEDQCIDCGACQDTCPSGAIESAP